jgi:hypothetical protein
MPPIVLEAKGKNMFSFILYALRLFASLLPLALHLPFPSYCDIAQDWSYFVSTVSRLLNVEMANI